MAAENQIAQEIVEACYKIHSTLGPGLLESVYEAILAKELSKRGRRVRRQKPVSICWEGEVFEEGFRADLIVDDLVIVELKSVETLGQISFRQLLTYLRLTGCTLGLLVNFNEAYIKDGIKRVVNGLEEE